MILPPRRKHFKSAKPFDGFQVKQQVTNNHPPLENISWLQDMQLFCRKRPNVRLLHFQIICAIYDRGRTPEKAKQPKVRPLVALATSWQTRNESATAGIRPRRLSSASQSGDNLRQSDWSRLEEFLRNQLAYLDNDEEVKAKV